MTVQAHLQEAKALAAAAEQQALQLMIIGGFGPMKLLETLDKQPLHGSLLGSSCLHKAAMSSSLLVAYLAAARAQADQMQDHQTDETLKVIL